MGTSRMSLTRGSFWFTFHKTSCFIFLCLYGSQCPEVAPFQLDLPEAKVAVRECFQSTGCLGTEKTCLLREFDQWQVVLGFPKQLMTCRSAGVSKGVCRTQRRWNRWHWAGHRDFLRIFCQSFSDLDTAAVDHPNSVRSLVSADVTNPSDQWTSKTRFSGKGWLFIEKPEFQDLCCWPQKTRVHWDWGQNGLATWTMEFQLSRAAK